MKITFAAISEYMTNLGKIYIGRQDLIQQEVIYAYEKSDKTFEVYKADIIVPDWGDLHFIVYGEHIYFYKCRMIESLSITGELKEELRGANMKIEFTATREYPSKMGKILIGAEDKISRELFYALAGNVGDGYRVFKSKIEYKNFGDRSFYAFGEHISLHNCPVIDNIGIKGELSDPLCPKFLGMTEKEIIQRLKDIFNEEASAYYCGGTLCIDSKDDVIMLTMRDESLSKDVRFWLAKNYLKYKSTTASFYALAESIIEETEIEHAQTM